MTHASCARRAVLALAVLCAASSTAVAGPNEKTFASEVAVIEHLVKSLAADDFDGALQAFATEAQVARHDFATRARRLGFIMVPHSDAPSRDKLYLRINTLAAMKQTANELLSFTTGFFIDKAALSATQPADATAFLQKVDQRKLATVKLVRIALPRRSSSTTPYAAETFAKQAAGDGFDALTERIALLQLADQNYICGFRLVKIGDSWHIHRLTSNMASGPGHSLLGVEKITPAEFDALTK